MEVGLAAFASVGEQGELRDAQDLALDILDTLLPHRSILVRKGLERQSGRGTAIRTDSQAQMIGRTHILLAMAVISSTVSSVLSRFQAFSDLAFVVIE